MILVVAATNIYLLTQSQTLAQFDSQLKLLPQHKQVVQLYEQVNLTATNVQNIKVTSLPELQDSKLAGVLFYHYSDIGVDHQQWFTEHIDPLNNSAIIAGLYDSIGVRHDETNGVTTSFVVNGQPYRALVLPFKADRAENMAVVIQLNGMSSAYLALLLWIIFLSLLLVGITSCLYIWRSKKRMSRWLSEVKIASVDRLTGLPNQQQLLLDLDNAEHTNLAFLKLHNFNSILNNYGPAVADDVLRQISAVIVNFDHPLLKKPSCYHLQPAVFAILEDQDINYEGISSITKSLIKLIIKTQYKVGDGEYVSVNVTTGAVRQNQDAFMLANMALQEAETKKLQFYLIDEHDSWLQETYKRELSLTQVLLEGIKDQRIVAYYQPIFSAKNSQVEKYECLARLVDQNGEIQLMPNVFIPLAHRANLYYLITKAMINHAVKFAQTNQVVVSLNLSVTDINNKRTCDFLFGLIKKSSVGHLLQFELLENEAIIESEQIIEFIKKLQGFGCQVGMDDLGKGHSNIERLLKLPLNFVKIDRTIMENVIQNIEMQNLARGIVKLAHKKGFEVVAEYCANKSLVNIAIDLGADFLQGFYLGKPTRKLFNPKTNKWVLNTVK